MKKLIFAAGAIILASCTSAPKAVITAELTNIEDQKVYFNDFVDGKPVAVDSALIVGGKFTITTENVYPRQAFISFEKNARMRKAFIVEPGTITIKGDFTKMFESTVTGTPTADLITAYEAEMNPIQLELRQLNKDFGAIRRDSLKAEEVTVLEDALRAKYMELNTKSEEITKAAIEKNAGNVFGAYLAAQSRPSTYEEVDAVLTKFSAEMPKNKFVDDLTVLKEKLAAVRVGQVAPDFTVQTPEGQDITLSSHKGQVVLVDFWASWCGPCRSANPSVVALYAKYKDAGFTVFGVSLDESKEAWIQAIADDNLTWSHGSDLKGWNAEAAKLYAVSGIPHTVLLDREGKIVGDNLHGAELEAKIAELTGSAVPAAEATPAQ